MRYDVGEDGTVRNGRVFFDVTAEKEDGLPDGMKVDSRGNIYGASPLGSVGVLCGRQTPGYHQAGGDPSQLQLGL